MSSCVCILGAALSLVKLDYSLIVAGMFLQMLGGLGSLTAGHCFYFVNLFTYSSEILGESLRVKFPPVAFAIYGLSGIFVNVVSAFVAHYSFYIYLNAGSILALSVLYCFLVESPFYLYKAKNVQKLYRTLLKIGQRNLGPDELAAAKSSLQSRIKYGKCFGPDPEQSPPEPPKAPSNFDVDKAVLFNRSLVTHPRNLSLDLRKKSAKGFGLRVTKQELLNLLKMVFVFFQTEGIFQMSLIVNKRLGLSNVHLCGVLVGLFQIVGYSCGLWFALRMGRRSLNILSACAVCFLSVSLLALDLVSNHFSPYFHRSKTVRVAETGGLH